MPDYDFRSLSPIDFEHLTRDALNADLGLRLQSYAAGRDQGIDLRQVSDTDGTIVGQCKHYLESDQRTFIRAVKKEGKRGKDLASDRYLFVTSRPLTPPQQDQIVTALAPHPIVVADVWGREALNAALVRHPEVERSHIKLWISSSEVLDTLIRAGQWQRSRALLESLAERSRRWVHTPSYDRARQLLEREGVCIISGPPGVGKTILAEMLLLDAASRGWQIVHVGDNIEDAWGALHDDSERQLFFYDDFLGQMTLELAGKNEPTSLSRFLEHLGKRRPTKGIVLTTREQVLQEAAGGPADRLSELARHRARMTLTLDEYDERRRAEILFNHLYFADLAAGERAQLAIDNRLITISSHPSYSPRLIEVGLRLSPERTADSVLATISRALEDPRELWQGSFQTLSTLEQQILLTLAALPRRPCLVAELRQLIRVDNALDWTPALRHLEGSWLTLLREPGAPAVMLANPSCRDYLHDRLDDAAVAEAQLSRVARLDQFITLAQTAGLAASGRRPLAVQRAELASTMVGQRAVIAQQVMALAGADLNDGVRPIASRIRSLIDSVALLITFGPADGNWTLGQAEGIATAAASSTLLPVPELFELAEVVATTSTTDVERKAKAVTSLLLVGAGGIRTMRDLDACEALAADLRCDEVQMMARERAAEVIEQERLYLLDTSDERQGIEIAAHDLKQRAAWYDLPLDIGPLLEHAAAMPDAAASARWDPEPSDDQEVADDWIGLPALFSGLAPTQDGADEE